MQTKALLPFALILITLASCKKDTITDAYLRGGNSLIKTTDGNMLIAGYNIGGNGSYDGYLAKVSLSGEVLWSKTYGNNLSDGFYNVINSSGGGYIATGFFSNTANNLANLILLKTNEQGDVSWLANIGDTINKSNGTKITQGFASAPTADGGYIACGYIQNGSEADRDIYLVKVNSNGSMAWDKRYGKQGVSYTNSVYDAAYGIVPSGDSVFYITGSMNGNINCCGKTFLMKIDTSGDTLWTKTYSQGLGYSLATTSDGGVIIGGTRDESGENIYLLKTDGNGLLTWEKSFGGTGYDFGTTVIQTIDGGYAITGFSTTSTANSQDIILIKTDASGNSKFQLTYGSSDVEQGFGLVQHDDGGFSIAGMSNSGGSYIYLDRTDALGIEIWQKNLK